jgi:hypothetical protein
MFNAILDLFLKKRDIEVLETKPSNTELRTVYRYDPAFDDDEPTLEEAYNFYEQKRLCHILVGGHIKFYLEKEMEFAKGNHSYPKNIFEII